MVAVLVVCHCSIARAQSAPQAGDIEITAGLRLTGTVSVGASQASETAPSGSRFTLFEAKTTMEPSAGVEGSLSIRLTPQLDAGVAVSFASAALRTRLTLDVEGIPDVEASESMTEVALEGAIVLHLPRWRVGERATPMLSAGGGYLRHLHEGRTVVQGGAVYRLGIGLDYVLFKGRDAITMSGLRGELRGVIRTGGSSFDDKVHVAPALGLLWFVRF